MPRSARILAAGHAYHAISRANAGTTVFRKPPDYAAFVEVMRKAKERWPLRVLAYCLMPNHVHFVLMPDEPRHLSKWMHLVLTTHTVRFHKHHQTSGHLWQGRFKSFPIQRDAHLLVVLRYVEANPVRAGLVQEAADWPWSSHAERIGRRARLLLDDPPIPLPDNWAAYVNLPLGSSVLTAIRTCTRKGEPLGQPDWTQQLTERPRE
ncbi:MAG: REP-associated tyrosine transposase [Candidatus Bipolaricaulaceae bacterium]